ncbi:MAG TPA: ABC transporter ATP-binding protein [Sedimenticola thiotaurini]|uniref:ABC transporter ATP-binding protein n=1 Tax=Sedimenticola thiotaurini TaxID=1543721 RepID=A0A831RNG3_9GAMM|nr:ABC transporter ATP-binding protein [Sedimenticola thiotaurini]
MEHRLSTLLGHCVPGRGLLLVIVLLMLGESAASLATPWFAGQFAAAVMDGRPVFGLAPGQIILLWLGLFLGQALLRFFSSYLTTSTGARVLTRLSNRLYDHLQLLPLDVFQQRKRGDLLALLSNDVAILSHFVTGTLTGLVPMLFTLVGALVLMAAIDGRVTLLAALLVPTFFLILKLMGRGIRPVSRELTQRQADMLALAEENIGLLPLIKAFNREGRESQRFRRHSAGVLRLRSRQLRLQAALSPVIQLLASAGILLVLWVSSEQLRNGQLTAPELVSLLLYGLLFARPVSSMANLYGQVQQVRGAGERLLELFAIAPEPDDRAGVALPPVRGDIDFRDVAFAYPGRPPLFDGLDLHLDAGSTVAVTGPNGVGKSTLLHLLMRFVEPARGRIEIDGIDIAGVSLYSLRRQIGLVTQHVLLADATVEENIRFGHPEADAEAVEAAARAAHAHEFILELPQGYRTRIGEQGVRLSGGQRQRIALARALLTDPPILLLDEATAMFDAEGERRFIASCRDTFEGRTVLMITHRPATLALADRIVRLGGGSGEVVTERA